jgi:hypothetical protein
LAELAISECAILNWKSLARTLNILAHVKAFVKGEFCHDVLIVVNDKPGAAKYRMREGQSGVALAQISQS